MSKKVKRVHSEQAVIVVGDKSVLDQLFRPRQNLGLGGGGGGGGGERRCDIRAEGALPPGLIIVIMRVISECCGICKASKNKN